MTWYNQRDMELHHAPDILDSDMDRRRESLIVKMAKHPFIWAGTGILIRNYDYYTERAEFWKTVGTIALVAGIAHSLEEHARGGVQGRTMGVVLRQIFAPHTVKKSDKTAVV